MVKPSPPHSVLAPGTAIDRLDLQSIVQDVRTVLPSARHVLIYGSANSDSDAGDVDLAVVTDDGADRFEALRSIAPFLAQEIIRSGVLVTCFPIEARIFAEQASQFVKNVRSDGRSF